MKKIIILFNPSENGYAQEKLFLQKSAQERAFDWAQSIEDCSVIETVSYKDILKENKTSTLLMLNKIEELAKKHSADYVIFAWSDCPFLNKTLTKKLIEYHENYKAEYIFAEGFPYGLAPEIIHASTVSVLKELVESRDNLKNLTVERDFLFTAIKAEINSFEIETFMADEDWRYLRLQLCCNNKRNTLACDRLFDIAEDAIEDAHALSAFAETCSSVQRTLPAFYNIQIHSVPFQTLSYEPVFGDEIMEVEKFRKVMSKIHSFSDDSVVSLSFLSDPIYHTDFIEFVKIVIDTKNTSLVIETDGLGLTSDVITSIATIVGENSVLATGQRKINWIIRLDSCDEELYKKIHINSNDGDYSKVLENIQLLKKDFPNAVYPQFTRMNSNEHQLEGFFRMWAKDTTGELIVQKFDHLSQKLPDVRPADLTPAKRYPCWHIKRDMNILANGNVARCKAAAFSQDPKGAIIGNAFEEDLATIWARGEKTFINQLDKKYEGQCENSDEWYTFNF